MGLEQPHRARFRVFLLACAAMAACATGKRPNILLLMADQHRWDRVDEATTPNLWRLKQEGVSFSNTYSSVPICTPARAALLSGLSQWCGAAALGVRRRLWRSRGLLAGTTACSATETCRASTQTSCRAC